jgi:hypothetical protein
MSGSVRKRVASPHTYDALVMLALTSESPEIREHLSQIDKDLLRTFPGTRCCGCPRSFLPFISDECTCWWRREPALPRK